MQGFKVLKDNSSKSASFFVLMATMKNSKTREKKVNKPKIDHLFPNLNKTAFEKLSSLMALNASLQRGLVCLSASSEPVKTHRGFANCRVTSCTNNYLK